MNFCPDDAWIVRFLDNAVPAEEQALFQDHYEECASCQQALDRLTNASPSEAQRIVQGADRDRTVVHSGPGAAAVFELPAVPGYVPLRLLGEGGMGLVFEAIQTGTQRKVAVKMIKAGIAAGSEEQRRFRDEAEAVARLQHANIVQIFEVGECQGQPFFSMEMCPGGSLALHLSRNPVSAHQAAEWCRTLAIAVHAAHEKQILHRDLKPANILRAEDGTLKIADFGLAKRMDRDDQHTRAGVPVGTPSYMAPEQARGDRSFSPATDVYALGAILYELLTGRPPFRGDSQQETLRQVQEDDPATPRVVQPSIPRDLETICLKCLTKEPKGRYHTANALAADLGHYLAGEPIVARPMSRVERSARWVRRHPATAGIVTLVVLAILSVAFAYIQMLEAKATVVKGEARRLIDLALADAKHAFDIGAWDQCVMHLDRTVKLGHDLTPEEHLLRARALIFLQRNDEAYAELGRLERQMGQSQWSGLIDLYRGDTLWMTDNAKAEELITVALEKQLPDAERWYAKGAMAKSMSESIGHFKKALEIQPFHVNARGSLAMALMFSGNLNDAEFQLRIAESQAKNDPQIQIGLGLLHYLRGNEKEGDECFEVAERAMGLGKTNMLKTGCKLFPQIHKNLRIGLGLDQGIRVEPGLEVIQAFVNRQPDRRVGAFKPAVQDYFHHLYALCNIHITNDEKSLAANEGWQQARRYVQDHPEGFLRVMAAFIEMNASETAVIPTKDKDKDKAFEESLRRVSKSFQLALKSAPSSIFDIRQEALEGLIYAEGLQGATVRVNPDKEAAKRGAANVCKAFFLKEGSVPPSRYELYFKIARNGEDWQIARILSDQWIHAVKNSHNYGPEDLHKLFTLRAEMEKFAEEPYQAFIHADRGLQYAKLLKKEPKRKEMEQILEWAKQRMKFLTVSSQL